jgi:multidrug efflux pump subunit AcrA (membrane-fusion protein)
MKTAFSPSEPGSLTRPGSDKPGAKAWAGSAVGLSILAGAVIAGPHLLASPTNQAAAPPLPVVAVSTPLQRGVDTRLQLLGQFSAVDSVELRAQVGGTLTKIDFKDGDIVHKGDLLFVIDPTPYQIKLSEATAQLESARARLDLASRELVRAQTLKRTGFGTVENADQRAADQRADQAAIDDAEALVRDARFDLDHCYITAPSPAASAPTWSLSAILSPGAGLPAVRPHCSRRSSRSTRST